METFIGMHDIGHERPETFFKMHWTINFDNNNKYLRTRSPRPRIKEVCDKVEEIEWNFVKLLKIVRGN
jgi:hypothetical protein